MKWIKASERIPDIAGRYFVKDVNGKKRTCIFYTQSKTFSQNVIEWLDEESPPNTVPLPASGVEEAVMIIPKHEEIRRQASLYAKNEEMERAFTDPERYSASKLGYIKGFGEAIKLLKTVQQSRQAQKEKTESDWISVEEKPEVNVATGESKEYQITNGHRVTTGFYNEYKNSWRLYMDCYLHDAIAYKELSKPPITNTVNKH